MEADIIKEINKELLKNEGSLINQYVDIFNKAIKHYGKNLLLFIEVGSFYEMYCPYEKGLLYEDLVKVSKITDIQLTRKNNKIKEINFKNPFLLGFNSHSKNKYLTKLIQTNKFNILIINQTGNAKEKNVKRQVENVLSVGTNLEHSKEENYIMSLDIEKDNDIYQVGISYMDVSIGNIYINEYYSNKEDNTKALDNILDYFLQFNISQININLDKNIDATFICNYLELKDNYHITYEKRKLEYQNTLLNKIYKLNGFITPIEEFGLSRLPLATNSLIFLLEHIIDYEHKLLNNITAPQIINNNNNLYLGNNAIEQLNIINKDGSKTLLDILNNCSTTFGKRFFKERLLHPITDIKELNRRYNLSESFKDNYEDIKKVLIDIYDLEKIKRKIAINKIHPYEIAQLYFSLKAIISNDNLIPNNLKLSEIKDLLYKIEDNFLITDCLRYNNDSINQNLLKEKINNELDTAVIITKKIKQDLENFIDNISTFYKTKDFITLQYNDKDGFYFLMTKTRYKLLEKDIDERYFKFQDKNIFMNEFNFQKRVSQVKLIHPLFKKLNETYLINLNKIININKDFFNNKIYIEYKKYIDLLEKLTIHISDIDIAVCNINNSILYNYNKPNIIESEKQSIEAIQLRHPIIERILENNKFIPNDLVIGETFNEELITKYDIKNNYVNGILLFGLNSSGKSSIQKALGLNIIMAQAGLYVPSKSFTFTLYNQLFTRILSKDNPDRGLSTFAVEMLELKNILQRGDNKSLVLGDEICHGTETTSAVSIVSAAILFLSERNINFLFATHLHQLIEIKEIINIKNLIFLHLEVKKENDILIYNRILKKGSGSSIYGLEFVKSLNMNQQFIKYANNFLNEIDLKNQNELKKIIKNPKGSKYNNKLHSQKCSFCDNLSIDYHHIIEQQNSDKNNRIDGGLHKNHLSNLLPLCKEHHKKVHDYMKNNDIEGEDLFKYVITSKGLKLIINSDLKRYLTD